MNYSMTSMPNMYFIQPTSLNCSNAWKIKATLYAGKAADKYLKMLTRKLTSTWTDSTQSSLCLYRALEICAILHCLRTVTATTVRERGMGVPSQSGQEPWYLTYAFMSYNILQGKKRNDAGLLETILLEVSISTSHSNCLLSQNLTIPLVRAPSYLNNISSLHQPGFSG